MSIRHILFAGAVVLGVSSGTPAGAADVLNLARVRQLAAAGQPQLVAQSAAVQAARETAVAEAQLPDPRLKLGLQNVPVDGFALNREPMTQAMVAVEQMLPGGNKRALRAARAEAEASQMNAELDARRRQIERDAALAFVSLRGAQRQLDVARRLSRESANQVESLAPALRTGKSSQADYYAARTMVTMAHHREAELAAQVGRARADLSRWVGTAAEDALADEPELPLPPPKPLARMLDALERHPEHAMAAQAVGVADAEVALAREAGRPDKSIEIGYGRRARAFADMVSFGVAVPLPLFAADRQDRGIRASRAALAQARASREDLERQHRAELVSLLDEWQRLGRRISALRSSLLPLARDRIDLALAAYRGGSATLAQVLDTRRAEVEARAQVLALQRDRARVWAQLNFRRTDTPVPLRTEDAR
jgi:cobalt-zinc-cadmium efflux system outer membrane protein